jgi:hypothetical protein
MQNTLNLPLGQTRGQQLQALSAIKEAAFTGIVNHPALHDIIDHDPEVIQLVLLYQEAKYRQYELDTSA